jgi:hypothetical protein
MRRWWFKLKLSRNKRTKVKNKRRIKTQGRRKEKRIRGLKDLIRRSRAWIGEIMQHELFKPNGNTLIRRRKREESLKRRKVKYIRMTKKDDQRNLKNKDLPNNTKFLKFKNIYENLSTKRTSEPKILNCQKNLI